MMGLLYSHLDSSWGEGQDQKIPDRLVDAVKNKNGNIFKLNNNKSDLEKGLELRKIASKYEYIILHIHMHDIVPIITFGNAEFSRPVIFYNHADHRFWVGVSISDIIADLRIFGQNITLSKRCCSNSFILSVPVDIKNYEQLNKETILKKLNLPLDKKIVLTIGGSHKYKPMLGLDFVDIIEYLLVKEDIIFIAVGPNLIDTPHWKQLLIKFNNRLILTGNIPHNNLKEYITIADLVLDSFPMSGGTALIDAISLNKPVLSFKNPVSQFDYVLNSIAYCDNIEELKSKSLELLYNNKKAIENIENVKNELSKQNTKESWLQNLKLLYSITPKKHNINNFKTNKIIDLIDNDLYLYNASISEKILINIFNIFTITKIKSPFKKSIIIKLFHKIIYKKEKSA